MSKKFTLQPNTFIIDDLRFELTKGVYASIGIPANLVELHSEEVSNLVRQGYARWDQRSEGWVLKATPALFSQNTE